ncbi:hypothetical protein A3Q56_02004 [Intoshia linei]|uniref:HAT C-terminal dimerisation domain-containing protein n=1 Tax=Intoshia linei TaxID=1819745 RepID=A0A177B7E3_9BILA|nr:hypothetical protein A3Q56_02004 [Intoshia linei]
MTHNITCHYDEKTKIDSKTTIIQLMESCNSNFFPNIYQLLIILATLPITTCERERSISILEKIENRFKINNDW